MYSEDELPRNVYYGDGSSIETEVLEEINRAYLKARFNPKWQKGDVLLLDNLLMAHGRMPFKGDRNVLVTMSNR